MPIEQLQKRISMTNDIYEMHRKSHVNDARTAAGEIRYDDPETAQAAVEALNGSEFGGATIHVRLDPHSKDNTRLIDGAPDV